MRAEGERQETYQTAIDLLTDLGWREDYDRSFGVVKDFTIPFVRAANRVLVPLPRGRPPVPSRACQRSRDCAAAASRRPTASTSNPARRLPA